MNKKPHEHWLVGLSSNWGKPATSGSSSRACR